MMPALSACTSSPVPGTSVTIDTSAVRMMSTSSCPTPTVSMMTTSVPAASSTSAASPVARARPPRCPRVAMLRMNTPSSAACACMRTRSPRTAPPVNGLVGSTAITPTEMDREPAETVPFDGLEASACGEPVEPCGLCAFSAATSRSTSVLFPAPGGPVTPITYARPVRLKIARTRSAPDGSSSSIREMARAIARGSPASTRSASVEVTSATAVDARSPAAGFRSSLHRWSSA